MPESNGGIAHLPGFAESLRLLIEREQYSMHDIAMMFGVSRERIRQIANLMAVPHPGPGKVGLMALRVWDDDAHCFRPILRGELRRQRRRERVARRRQEHLARVNARRRALIATVQDLRRVLGRDPTYSEIAERVFPGEPAKHGVQACAWLLGKWGRIDAEQSARARLREFRGATGLTTTPGGHRRRLAAERRANAEA
jgi:hypothetical protein